MIIDPASMIGADYKSALQERLQASGGPGPDYAVVEVLGPDHRRIFRVELRIGGRAIAMGEGHTIKLAQQEAARGALESLDELISIASAASDIARLNGDDQRLVAKDFQELVELHKSIMPCGTAGTELVSVVQPGGRTTETEQSSLRGLPRGALDLRRLRWRTG